MAEALWRQATSFIRDGNFVMDAQLRATHGSFDGEDGKIGVDMFTGLVGVNWY